MKRTFSENGPDLLVVVGEMETGFLEREGFSRYSVEIERSEWNDLLSPWPCKPVFKKGGAFGGKADELINEVLPELNTIVRTHPGRHYIMGYSLAGMFSLYLTTRCEHFDGVASVSGSLWFPGFAEYLRANPAHIQKAVLTLGDTEKNSRSPIMSTVEEKTIETEKLLSSYAECVFTLNPGSHFNDPKGRMSSALDHLIG